MINGKSCIWNKDNPACCRHTHTHTLRNSPLRLSFVLFAGEIKYNNGKVLMLFKENIFIFSAISSAAAAATITCALHTDSIEQLIFHFISQTHKVYTRDYSILFNKCAIKYWLNVSRVYFIIFFNPNHDTIRARSRP